MKITDILKLMRLHHYVKNLFIFLPLFFASRITDPALLFDAVIAFLAFSITASAIYILNDYHDIEDDRHHPRKKNRPLAAGDVTKPQALLVMALLFIVGLALMASVSYESLAVLVAYVSIILAYNFYLKYVAILDVTVIATGFVLRLYVGSTATGVSLSMWIVIMTFLLALFLALAKRRDDVLIFLGTGKKVRKVVDGYNLHFLDTAMAIMASVLIVAYIIYTISAEVTARPQSDYLYLTAFFVIMGVMRYLQIAFVIKESASPARILLEDRFLQLMLLGWVAAFAWILY